MADHSDMLWMLRSLLVDAGSIVQNAHDEGLTGTRLVDELSDAIDDAQRAIAGMERLMIAIERAGHSNV